MFKVQIFDKISPVGLSLFKKEHYQLSQDWPEPDVILVRSHSLHNHPFSKQLQAIGRAGTGTDNIPLAQATQRGIPVFYAPGANANAVKELTLAAILIGYRNLDAARQFLCGLSSETSLTREIEDKKKNFVGHEILGKTLGIIGLGNIGVKVANAAQALGMRVLAYDPNMTLSSALALMPQIEKTTELNEVLNQADILTLHVPLSAATKHLMNQETLQASKPGALLLNFSREAIVAEDAVVEQLDKGHLMGYITDFPTPHLINHPKVLSFPHLGASTVEAEQNAATKVIRNIRNYLEFGTIEDAVNFPNTYLHGYDNCPRLLVVNRNIPGAIALITENISRLGFNIEQMVNNSRDEVAVNLIDLRGSSDKLNELQQGLQALPHVIRINHIQL